MFYLNGLFQIENRIRGRILIGMLGLVVALGSMPLSPAPALAAEIGMNGSGRRSRCEPEAGRPPACAEYCKTCGIKGTGFAAFGALSEIAHIAEITPSVITCQGAAVKLTVQMIDECKENPSPECVLNLKTMGEGICAANSCSLQDGRIATACLAAVLISSVMQCFKGNPLATAVGGVDLATACDSAWDMLKPITADCPALISVRAPCRRGGAVDQPELTRLCSVAVDAHADYTASQKANCNLYCQRESRKIAGCKEGTGIPSPTPLPLIYDLNKLNNSGQVGPEQIPDSLAPHLPYMPGVGPFMPGPGAPERGTCLAKNGKVFVSDCKGQFLPTVQPDGSCRCDL